MRTQDLDGAIRVHAVGSPAVSDVLISLGKLAQPSLEIVDWDRNRAGNMTGGILRRRPRIENDDTLRPSAFQELIHPHSVGVRAPAEMLPDQTF